MAALATTPRLVPTAAATGPLDLATIKDDLGMPCDDTANDAWLQRQVAGVWAQMEAYCMRRLASPPATFVDDWGKVVSNNRHHNQPPPLMFPPRASVFLRHFPVVSIEAFTLNDLSIDPATVLFDAASGKLFSTDDAQLAHDVGQELLTGRARITYTAGYDDLPLNLYQCLLGALQPLWSARQSQTTGGGGGTITGINVMDVGSIEMGAGNAFVSASNRGAGAAHPVLGPFTTLLDPFVDWRQTIGSPLMAVTEEVPVAMAAPP